MKQATVQTVYEWVDRLAPFETAMEWDNVGLLLGARERPVDTVLTALDLTPGVIEEAVGLGAQVVVTHHPMLAPLRRLDEAEPQAALLCAAVRAGISWIAAHTNLDMAEGGVNDALAERLGWQVTETDGFLRVGDFEAPRALEAVREEVERALGWPVWRFGPAGAKVRRFALCSGSGGSEVQSALRHGAQLFLTGEVRHDAAGGFPGPAGAGRGTWGDGKMRGQCAAEAFTILCGCGTIQGTGIRFSDESVRIRHHQ